MNQLLSTILKEQKVVTQGGDEEVLHSSIDVAEAELLTRLIQQYKVKRTLEVGCAMGISSLAICDSLQQNGADTKHLIIDPYQSTYWKNIGVHNLQKAGFRNYELIEEPSEFALPRLVQENHHVDLAFIDGWHTFDHTLIDFFYINRILKPGGILVVDDVQMPAVKRVVRMIQTYPAYRYLDAVCVRYTGNRRVLEVVRNCIRPFAKLMGKKLAGEIYNGSVLRPDRQAGLDCSVIALQKTSVDNRTWNWYENF